MSASGTCHSRGATFETSHSSNAAAAATSTAPPAPCRSPLSAGMTALLVMLHRSDYDGAQERKIRPHEDGFFCKHDEPTDRLTGREPRLGHQLLRDPELQAVLDTRELQQNLDRRAPGALLVDEMPDGPLERDAAHVRVRAVKCGPDEHGGHRETDDRDRQAPRDLGQIERGDRPLKRI